MSGPKFCTSAETPWGIRARHDEREQRKDERKRERTSARGVPDQIATAVTRHVRWLHDARERLWSLPSLPRTVKTTSATTKTMITLPLHPPPTSAPTRPEDTESEETYLDATRVPATFWVEVAALASVRVAVHDGDDKMTLKVLYPDVKRTCNNCVPLGQLIIRSG